MKRVCYFECVLDPVLFENILTEGGDITLTKVDRDMPESEIKAALADIHGYHTRGGSQLVPERFRINRDLDLSRKSAGYLSHLHCHRFKRERAFPA